MTIQRTINSSFMIIHLSHGDENERLKVVKAVLYNDMKVGTEKGRKK